MWIKGNDVDAIVDFFNLKPFNEQSDKCSIWIDNFDFLAIKLNVDMKFVFIV